MDSQPELLLQLKDETTVITKEIVANAENCEEVELKMDGRGLLKEPFGDLKSIIGIS